MNGKRCLPLQPEATCIWREHKEKKKEEKEKKKRRRKKHIWWKDEENIFQKVI